MSAEEEKYRKLANQSRNITEALILLIVIGIGILFLSVQAEVKKQTLYNAQYNLEHRVRHEHCVVQPIRNFFDSAVAGKEHIPFPEECRHEDTKQLLQELSDVNRRIKEEI